MSIGKRRPKLSRANLRPSAATVSLRQDRLARQRSRAAVLGLVAASLVATAAIVHGSGPPFTYRIGERPDRELRVNVKEFRIRNQTKSSNERQAAADQVAPVMVNDPTPIAELSKRLDDLTVTIAKASRFEDIPENVRAAWGLLPESFLELKSATDTPERRDTLQAQIAEAFQPLIRDGILGTGTLPPNEDASVNLSIRQPKESRPVTRLVPRDRVVPERMIKPDGPVYKEFCNTFTSPRIGQILFGLIANRLDGTPTLTYEAQATAALREEARARVPDHFDTFSRGDVLVEQGETIGEEQLILLRLEHDAFVESLGFGDRVRRAGGILALVAALYVLTGYYISRHEARFVRETGRIAMICGLVVLALGAVRRPGHADLGRRVGSRRHRLHDHRDRLQSELRDDGHVRPLGVDQHRPGDRHSPLPDRDGGDRRRGAHPHRGPHSNQADQGRRHRLDHLLPHDVGHRFLAGSADRADPRRQFLRAGWGLMTGFFLGGSLPFLEGALGIVTGISLLELGDNTHPLLQELVRRAPGTHNHSITVGAIAEAAAERVGADSLLVRIGAYFHDIGKMLKPHYFVENQVGSINRHAKLAPAMSTLIIIGHVKDGVDLGRQHHLPEPIIDLIEQHHGTTLVEYFYYEANRRNGNNPDASSVPESAFRYPGPRPQTKEAAILMVADAVESASRTLSDPAPARLEGLVSDLIDKRLRDGQFDECGLTLREIAEIRDSLIKSLIGIYHGRVKYPEHRTA